MSALVLCIVGGILLSVPFILRPVIKNLAELKDTQLKFVTAFYKSAPALVANEAVPERIVEMLGFISRNISKRRAVYHLLGAWLRGDIGSHVCDEDTLEFKAILNSMPDDLRRKTEITIAVGLMAMTFASPIGGAIFRRLLLYPVGMPDRTDDAPMFVCRFEALA
jgi:hypothetical protein